MSDGSVVINSDCVSECLVPDSCFSDDFFCGVCDCVLEGSLALTL